MRSLFNLKTLFCDHRGQTLVVVAAALMALLALAALALDMGHLYIVRNELENAAAAGALAAARQLYNIDGQAVNTGANQIGYNDTIANRSDSIPVDVDWTSGNSGDVQRGHWSYATKTFTPNASTTNVALWNVTTDTLDADLSNINAVRVTARRKDTPAYSFLAGLFGQKSFSVAASAIAYVGYAGTLPPNAVNEPIAICKQSILFNGEYRCSIGRILNSSGDSGSSQTALWTNLNQSSNACTGPASAKSIRDCICGINAVCTCPTYVNPSMIIFGSNMQVSNGTTLNNFTAMYGCWAPKGIFPIKPWPLMLPVIDCSGGDSCKEMVGAVKVSVVWITGAGDDPDYTYAPKIMGSWSSNAPDGKARWASFVSYFNLQNLDGSAAPYLPKYIYFKPDCQPHAPNGRTGGENYGIRAKIPSLAQ